MRRREFMRLLGGSAAAWPVAARAQQPKQVRIGFLGLAPASSSTGRLAAFREGLGDLGFVEGKNVVFELRLAEGTDQLSQLAAGLVKDHVAVIVAGGNAAALAAKSATSAIPIVFTAADDPVRLGLVASFNKPGDNITGVSLISGTLGSKRFDLLHELVPSAVLIGILRNPNNPAEAIGRDEQAAAQAIGQRVIMFNIASENDIDAAFKEVVQKKTDAILVTADIILTAHRDQIVALAAHRRIPALYPWREWAEAGGLMSYGTSLADGYRQMGVYAGRILRGVKPADLPVTQPTRIELVINIKTAKALGLQISPKLLALADAVIE
jgi:putative tryptophan/tyrosine transport system substrate-binding protein